MSFQEWQNPKVTTSDNKHEYSSISQPGGTATMSFGTFTNTVSGTGVDPSGLGRLSWMILSGKTTCLPQSLQRKSHV